MSTLPLHCIKVIDLSRVLAGPLCSMMLADLGAQVIKVERPLLGDDTRGWGPPFDEHGEAAYFLSVNRNKLSIAADFADPQDLRLLLQLIGEADVVVENFLPGTLSRYGLDRAALLSRHANLIWCTISGFGDDSTRPGYDFVVQAESGWMAITGPVEGPPTKVGVALVDVIAGKDAAAAILAALVARGLGNTAERWVRVALAGSAAAALVNVAQNTLVTGKDAGRWGNAHPNLVPYQLFEAADRSIVIAVGSDAQWRSASIVLELGEHGASESFATNAGRVAGRVALEALISERVRSRPAAEWLERLGSAGVPCGLVRSVMEGLVDIRASARTGVTPAAGGAVRHPPPRLDEHGKLIRRHHWSAFTHVPILATCDV